MKLITTDPVCGMTANADSPHRADHAGATYLFCCAGCRERFVQEPAAYLGGEGATEQPMHTESSTGGSVERDYFPLLIIVLLTAAAALALQAGTGRAWRYDGIMHDFMGLFLVLFAMFKLFDLPGFADGFQRYDLLAKPVRLYALLYPFLELALGLGYLARWQPTAVYSATVVLMSFGTLGVVRSLLRRQKVHCACLGTVLRIPLSTVAVVENVGMAAMAGSMLLA